MTPSNITRIRRGRNYLKFLFLFILLIGYPHLALAQRNLTSLIQKVSPSVAIIYMLNDNTEFIGLGSGFFVRKEGVLLTNYHVIEKATRAVAKLPNGDILPIKGLVAEDMEGDLALLSIEIEGKYCPPLNISSENIRVGQPVVVVGSPLGLEGTISE